MPKKLSRQAIVAAASAHRGFHPKSRVDPTCPVCLAYEYALVKTPAPEEEDRSA